MRSLASRNALHVSQVKDMTTRLGKASSIQDWAAVRALDCELATLLASMRTDQRFSPDLYEALMSLRGVHHQAMLHCAMTSEDVATHLTSMLSNKEGWMAYAANSDWNGSQA